MVAPLGASNMTDSQPNPEELLAAQQQLLKILPYILGFGWVVMIPISYLFIAPVFVEEFEWRLLVTVGITTVTGIADFVFYKIFGKTVKAQAQLVEEQSSEAEQEPIEFTNILS